MGYRRFVAIGDSTTEGLDDPYPDGAYRGWADRLAGALALLEPDLLYANLAVRGRRALEVHEQQLGPALSLEPDLATVVAGLNDTLRGDFDLDATAGHIDAMFTELRAAGATVGTITFPDPRRVMFIARLAWPRLIALNQRIRESAERTGTIVVDLERLPVAGDPRLWSVDRLHANPEGHRRIADALAHRLGLPGAGLSWTDALPPASRKRPHEVVAAEASWAARYFLPWLIRRARGRSSGDGILAKRPDLAPIEPAWAEPDPLT
jgi:lysophospholipase L1-like esterase